MANSYLEQHRDFFGDDIYINDPVIKKYEQLKTKFESQEKPELAIKADKVESARESELNSENKIAKKVSDLANQVVAPFNDTKTTVLKQEIQNTVSKTESNNDLSDLTAMSQFCEQIKSCTKCALSESRNSFVFSKGNDQSDIMIIGEAPGAEEDRQGIPFVGRAGQLLDKILAAVDLDLTKVFITNIVKCRPPNNRDPEPNEIFSCSSYLDKQIELLQPKIILALGRIAGKTLLAQEQSLSSMRGKMHDYNGIPMFVTYHPSALLRNEAWKRPTWEDMKNFKKKYSELKGTQ